MSRRFPLIIEAEAAMPARPDHEQPLNIPGFHWDVNTKRYFKIDATNHDSYWSSASIAKRELERKDSEISERRRLITAAKPRRITRSQAFASPQIGGRLALELFGPATAATTASTGQGFTVSGLGTSNLWKPLLCEDSSLEECRRKRMKYTENDSNRMSSLSHRQPVPPDRVGLPSSSLAVVGLCAGGARPGLSSDYQNASLLASFENRGSVDMLWSNAQTTRINGNMASFLMHNQDERQAMGVVYATCDRSIVTSRYVPFSKDGRIDCPASPVQQNQQVYQEQIVIPGISSINYHPGSRYIVITSEGHSTSCSVYLFNPHRRELGGDAGQNISWVLGETDFYQRIAIRENPAGSRPWWTNSSKIAPPQSLLLCAMATNSGIVTLTEYGTLSNLIPPQLSPGELFGIDFLPTSRSVIVAGGRRGKVLIADLRTPPHRFEYDAIIHQDCDWYGRGPSRHQIWQEKRRRARNQPPESVVRSYRHAPITGVVAMNDCQILVSGILHKMCIYDLRWRKPAADGNPCGIGPMNDPVSSWGPGKNHYKRDRRWSGNTTMPLVTFPTYRNEVHIQHGLAVSESEIDSVGSVVAAAHDDGTIGLYSSHTGRRFACPAVDELRGYNNTPVRNLQWCRMPGDTHETLWAGIGTKVVGIGPVADLCANEP